MSTGYKKFSYDVERFPFRETMQEILGISELESLHKNVSWPLLTRDQDQSTPFHKLYYAQYKKLMLPLWDKFVVEVATQHFDEPIFYQKIPTFRVQIPGNVGVGEFHKDSDYGHTPGASNIFLPMVDLTEHNTIWAETEADKGDYQPIILKYGEYAIWDGVTHRHGNKLNPSDVTRVSVDARFLEESKYDESTAKNSINLKVKFGPGGYFAEESV